MKVKTLVIGILLALSLNACGDKPASIKSSTEQKASDYRVGNAINTDKFTISIDRVETRRSVGNVYLHKQASSGGIYVVVNYTYKNISNKPIGAFSLPRISLRSPDGSKYSADIDASSSHAVEIKQDEKIFSDLNPGIQTHGSQVFEVSEQMYSPTTWKIIVDADKEILVNINTGQNQTNTSDPQSTNNSNAYNQAIQNNENSASVGSPPSVGDTNNPPPAQSRNIGANEPDNVVIQNIAHPAGEPTGLYVVDFDKDVNSSYTYRVYCPTNTVRNISNNRWGNNKTADAEDRDEFAGEPVLVQVLAYTCSNK